MSHYSATLLLSSITSVQESLETDGHMPSLQGLLSYQKHMSILHIGMLIVIFLSVATEDTDVH